MNDGKIHTVFRICGMVIVVLLFSSLCRSQALAGEFMLARDGQSEYTIVLSRDASPSEKYAAKELQKFLAMMSGATIPVRRDNEAIAGPMILLGQGALLAAVDPWLDLASLGDEGFIIRTKGPHLVIAGSRLRGTMYGVHRFLENLGCRWYTPEVSRIPSMRTIRLPEIDIREIPAFEFRGMNWWCGMNGDWAARNGQNNSVPVSTPISPDGAGAGRGVQNTRVRLGIEHGGTANYMGVHTSYELISPYEKFENHPEYYAVRNGRRQWEYAQLCVMHPEVAKVGAQSIIDWIRRDPVGRIYSLTQEDWRNTCQCSHCLAMDAREESPSGAYIFMVNRAAKAVEKVYPDKMVGTFAYMYTLKPPRTVRPYKNVNIRLALIMGCDAHPLEFCPDNQEAVRSVKEWAPISHDTYVWDYTNNFTQLLAPFPNWWAMGEDLRFFRRMGIDGVFLQGNSYTEAGAFSDMQAWIQSHMLWNPDNNIFSLIDDFLNGYYGPAAPAMRRIIDLMQNTVRHSENHFALFSPPNTACFTPAMMEKYGEFLNEAHRAALGSPDIQYRLEESRMMLRYVKLSQPVPHVVDGELLKPEPAAFEYDDIDTRELHDFMEAANEHEIISLDEWGGMITRFEHMRVNMGTHRLIPLENDKIKLTLLPTLGGRIFSIYDKIGEKELLLSPQIDEARYSTSGGFRFGPSYNEIYYPEIADEPGGKRLILRGFLTNNAHYRSPNSFLETRNIFIPDGDAGFTVSVTIEALKSIGSPQTMSAGGSFYLGDPAQIRAGVPRTGGEFALKSFPGNADAQGRYSILFEGEELRSGSFCVVDAAAKTGVVVKFDPGQIQSSTVTAGRGNNSVAIALQGKVISFRKGDKASLDYSFSFLNGKDGILE